jgi:O-antigen/teichoic acid export membrane protein
MTIPLIFDTSACSPSARLEACLPVFLREKAAHLRCSLSFRRAAKNGGWSGLGFLMAPALQLMATPYLMKTLGIDIYGVWMLVNSMISVSGLASLGFGAAAVKFVSKYRARGDMGSVICVLRSTLTLLVLLASSLAIIVFFFAPIFANFFTQLTDSNRISIVSCIRVASLALLMRFLYSVAEAAAQGHERYDIESWFAIFNTIGNIGGACLLASMGKGLVEILWLNVAVLGLGMAGLSAMVGRLIGSFSWLAPGFNRPIFLELGGFAFWSWVQSIGTILYGQVDRLVIGAMLGPIFLSYYLVCVQLTVLTHGLLSRTVSFIFPMAAAMQESGATAQFRKLYSHGMAFSTALGFALNLPLFLFPQPILAAWLGVDTALNSAPILPYVALANTLLASTAVPYFFLNGAGYVRLNAMACLAFGISVAFAAILLIPEFGLVGAALARLFDLPVWLLLCHSIHSRILKDHRYWIPISGYGLILFGFWCAMPLKKLIASTALASGTLSLAIVASICIGFLCFYAASSWLYGAWSFKNKL